MTLFILGLFIGGTMGALGMALACAAGRADRQIENEQR